MVKVDLSVKEWLQIIERVKDDDFYYCDEIAQEAIRKIEKILLDGERS